MSNLAALPPPPPDHGKHCEPGEYEDFLARGPWSEDVRRRLLSRQRRFAATYPDLDVWAQLPLPTRLGWRKNVILTRRTCDAPDGDAVAYVINFDARQYLIYLSLTGRLHLDWGWLLGIGVLKPWTVAETLGLPLVEQVNVLAAKHRELGLSDKKCRHRVHWGVARLALHRADTDLHTLTIDDVEELRHVIRGAASIAGLPEVLGDKMDATLTNFGHWTFATGVALYHAGMIDALPKRQVSRHPRTAFATHSAPNLPARAPRPSPS